jgi:hypothetical protein
MVHRKFVVIALAVALILCAGSCSLLGPSLPSEIQGDWYTSYLSGAKNVISLGASTVRYRVYDSNGSLGTDWDREIVEVNTSDGWFFDDYDDYWMYHLEGSTLHLNKLGSNVKPSSVQSDWWADPTKDYSYSAY